ncbi:MAG TPA: hypothetical protein ENI34_02595 [candidate division WOR-3 bacterium]|uniref:Uncharacterized protein n=1 Tax=candidate division WOR-3 bacterium TaxID=2052148 RepID=A0A9C9EL81_UNCW3|nr:hypothetical protein [candidate division WOR-3 bacterium]
MPGEVKFEYDPKLNIVFTDDEGEIKTREDVDDFFEKYRKFFEKLGKKVYMVSHIDGLLVRAQIAEYYGERARANVGHYLLGFARWGTNDWARMTVRTTSMKAKMTANIYDTKEAAIAAIQKIKEKAEQKD